jgi:hypothetical protein
LTVPLIFLYHPEIREKPLLAAFRRKRKRAPEKGAHGIVIKGV